MKIGNKNERNEEQNEAAIGIGAMIVFIALILVAAVASAVIIQTAEKLQQNAQSTGDQTTDQMGTKITVVSVSLATAANLRVTFKLSPGSDSIADTQVLWTIVCAAGTDSGTFGNSGALNQDGATLGDVTTLNTNTVYNLVMATGNCNPAASTTHTLAIQAGGGGFTYETLQYAGAIVAGELVT